MFFSSYSGIKINYIIVVLLLLVSGNDVIEQHNHKEIIQVIAFLVLLAGYVLLKRPPLTHIDLAVFTIFLTIIGTQGVLLAFFPLVTVAGVCIRLGIGFLAVRSVDDFPRVYVNVMTGICMVSLIFYIPEQIFAAAGKDFSSLFDSMVSYMQAASGQCCDRHIFIYNFEDLDEVHANAGFFWESGAFAGYILLAVCFLGLAKEEYSRRGYYIRAVLLLVTVLTTASTAGYVAAPVALATHYRKSDISVAMQLGLVAAMIAMLPVLLWGVSKVWEQEVLGGKISEQYDKAVSQSGNWQINRFGNMLYDWQYIRERPLLGWGIHEETLWAARPQDAYLASGMGNGLTGFIRKFGFVGLATFLFFCGRGLYQVSGGRLFISAAALATVVLVLFGQQYLRYPLFLALFFLTGARPKAGRSVKATEQPRFDRGAFTAARSIAVKPDGQSGSVNEIRHDNGREPKEYSAVSSIALRRGLGPRTSK